MGFLDETVFVVDEAEMCLGRLRISYVYGLKEEELTETIEKCRLLNLKYYYVNDSHDIGFVFEGHTERSNPIEDTVLVRNKPTSYTLYTMRKHIVEYKEPFEGVGTFEAIAGPLLGKNTSNLTTFHLQLSDGVRTQEFELLTRKATLIYGLRPDIVSVKVSNLLHSRNNIDCLMYNCSSVERITIDAPRLDLELCYKTWFGGCDKLKDVKLNVNVIKKLESGTQMFDNRSAGIEYLTLGADCVVGHNPLKEISWLKNLKKAVVTENLVKYLPKNCDLKQESWENYHGVYRETLETCGNKKTVMLVNIEQTS